MCFALRKYPGTVYPRLLKTMTNTWLYIILVLYCIVVAAVVYIFVIADPEKNGASRFVNETLPMSVWSFLQRNMGETPLKVITFFSDRLLLVVYMGVVYGAWAVIFFYVYPWISQQSYVSQYHKVIGYFVFGACIASWYFAHTTSPGTITANNLDLYNHYPYDNLMFLEGSICPTQKIPRLPRSKFDRFKYHKNIPRYDHFCGWIYNVVGEENHRLFLLFLLVHQTMCVYGTFVLSYLLYGEIEKHDLLHITLFDRYTGEEYTGSYTIIGMYLLDKYTMPVAVYCLMVVMSFALMLFLGYHIHLVNQGLTSNESFKWDQVQKWYKRSLRDYEDAVKRGEVVVATETSAVPLVSDGDVSCTSGPRGEPKETSHTPRDPGPRPVNIYNRGIIANWKEVLFPVPLQRRKNRKAEKLN